MTPLVDTDVLYITHFARQDGRNAVNEQFLKAARSFCISIFNLLELCAKASFRARRQEVETLFRSYHRKSGVTVLYPRVEGLDAEEFFDSFIQRTMDRILQKMDFQDALIANIAEEHGVDGIVTWNTKHFSGKVSMAVLSPEEWLARAGWADMLPWQEQER